VCEERKVELMVELMEVSRLEAGSGLDYGNGIGDQVRW
jgi:hypothetical protein